jgi:WD40 repeat protein
MRLARVLTLLASVVIVTGAAAQPAKGPRLDVHGDPLPDGAVARLGTSRFQPPGAVRLVALSPDGTTVATAAYPSKEGLRVSFLDTSSGKTVRQTDLAEVDGERMQFTPDGKGLVFSRWSGIKLVDIATGKVTRSIDSEQVREPAVALSADGKWVGAQQQKWAYHAPVGVWDTKTGKEVASLPGRGASCKGLAFSDDGKRLLLWSLVPTHADKNSIGFDSKSQVAVACIDVGARKILGETTAGRDHFVALGPDGETVALEAPDRQSVRVRHLPTGAERCAIPVRQAKFAFGPGGKVLFTVDEGGRAALWDAAKGDKVRDLEGGLVHEDFDILGISKDGRTAAALDGGWRSAAVVAVWDVATGKRAGRPPGHDGAVTCVAYAPGGKLMASGGVDRTVRLWRPAAAEHLRVVATHKDEVTAVALSPDGKLVASSSRAGVTVLSAAADGKVVAEFTGPEKGATALAFSPEGTELFAGGRSPDVRAWGIKGAQEVVRLTTGHDGDVMAFGDAGALALTANGEIRNEEVPERLQVWDPAKGRSITSIPLRGEPVGRVHCAAAVFSPDGRLIASSQVSEYQGIRPSYGATRVCLWERASGQPIRTLAPAVTQVLAFSPDGRLLASGAAGRSGHLAIGYGSGLDVWDTLTGEKAGALPVSPQCVTFSPDGSHLATGGQDRSVLVWAAPKREPPRRAKAPAAAERDAWWAALGRDAKDAYAAIGQMLGAPDSAVTLLEERVRPVRLSDADEVARLIARLDSESFAEREGAQQALEKMGEGAAHLLVKQLQGRVSAESRRRLEEALSKCEATSAVVLRHHRAVAALEWVGTPAARALLRTLADGAPRARLTTDARAALKRLGG